MATLDTQKIVPCLWFDGNASDAAEFYCHTFKNAHIVSQSDLMVEFELENCRFMKLNGGPKFSFNESVSFQVMCYEQEEVDHFWDTFTENGGEESMCGWCKDKFGLSWQIIPIQFMELMKTGQEKQKKRMMESMMSMKKLIIKDFEMAYNA